MTDFEALKDSIAEKQFESEPLAFAIIKYLSKTNPDIMREILNLFNQTMEHNYKVLIKDTLDNQDSL